MTKITKNLKKQRGATMVEYAIMVALIAIVAIASVTLLGKAVSNEFSNIASTLNTGLGG